MYKLCIALAFLAVAAAKPNWPLDYAGLNEFGYPLTGYPSAYPYNLHYPAPVVKTVAPVVAKTYTAPVVTAPLVKTVAPVAPVAPIAPVASLAFHADVAPFYPAGFHAYDAAFPYVVKK